ncbi:MAG: hypothetical protein NWF08_07730 [Candidatus Bathyarchaeota archaeon]|nr:hypothetical protein [Candidatus Bathyarchaeota archaeon]
MSKSFSSLSASFLEVKTYFAALPLLKPSEKAVIFEPLDQLGFLCSYGIA